MARWGIDFDGCLADFERGMLIALNSSFGTNYQLCDVTHWEFWHEVPTREQCAYLWGKNVYWNREWTERLIPIKDSIEGLRRLVDADHEIMIVTDRHPAMKTWIENWLKTWLGYPLHVVMSNRYERPKMDVARELDIEYFLDDAPHHIESMKNKHHLKQAYLMDKPYNQNVVAGGNVKRIMSWNEVVA